MAAWIRSHPSQHFLQSFSVLLYKLVLISIGYCNSPHVTFKYSIDFFNLYATFFGYQYQWTIVFPRKMKLDWFTCSTYLKLNFDESVYSCMDLYYLKKKVFYFVNSIIIHDLGLLVILWKHKLCYIKGHQCTEQCFIWKCL